MVVVAGPPMFVHGTTLVDKTHTGTMYGISVDSLPIVSVGKVIMKKWNYFTEYNTQGSALLDQ